MVLFEPRAHTESSLAPRALPDHSTAPCLNILKGRAGRYRGPLDVLVATVRSEGPHALWTGFTPALLAALPYSAVLFGSYNALKPEAAGQYGARGTLHGVFR